MNNQTILTKFQQRLNKLASFDFDNIESWMILEAFNKAQLEFTRRSANTGEVDKQNLGDIQILLTEYKLKGNNDVLFYESDVLPKDMIAFNRISCQGFTKECKEPRDFKVYIGEESNLNELLNDPNRNPNFDWAETFATFFGNKIRIYTDNKFIVKNPILIYYKKPPFVKISGVFDLELGREATTDVECIFKDDVIELLIEEGCMILAGDIESFNQMQRNSQNIQRNQ